MTHHLGQPDPHRGESLFEKPTPIRREPPAEEPERDDAGTEEATQARTSAASAAEPPADETAVAAPGDDGTDDPAGARPADAPGDGGSEEPTTTWAATRPPADETATASGGRGPTADPVPDTPEDGARGTEPARDADVAVAPAEPTWDRPAVDPFATSPMPAARPVAARPGGDRSTDDPLADDGPTTHLFGAPALERTIVDDAPTEALPVVAPAAGESAPDDDAVAEWRPPKQTSRLTTILVIALLVAIGFLAGVFVGRAAAPNATSGAQPRPAATSPARPGALG